MNNIIIEPEKISIHQEQYLGKYEIYETYNKIRTLIDERIRGIPIGLPRELSPTLINLFTRSQVEEESDFDDCDITTFQDAEADIGSIDPFSKEELDIINEKDFQILTEEDKIIVDNIIEDREKKLLDFIRKNDESKMFSLLNYYNISDNNRLMMLNPKIDFEKPVVKKYVTLEALHTNSLEYLEKYKHITKEDSYDLLFMLAKEAPSGSFEGHFVTVIVRKRKDDITVNILDPLREKNREDLESKIKDFFFEFFEITEKNYKNIFCGQQRKIDRSNCGFFSYKFIYNYLLLSYDNDDVNVLKAICPGRKASSFGGTVDRIISIRNGPGNTVLDESEKTFQIDPTIPVKNFYYLTTKERNFIIQLIDRWNGKIR